MSCLDCIYNNIACILAKRIVQVANLNQAIAIIFRALPSQSSRYLALYIVSIDSRFAPNQWETALFCNDVSHWLGATLKSADCDA